MSPRRLHLPFVYAMVAVLPLGATPARIGLLVAGAAWAVDVVARRRRRTRTPMDAPILLLIGSAAASVALSPWPIPALRAASSAWILLAFFLAVEVAGDATTVRRLLMVLLAGGTLAALLATAGRGSSLPGAVGAAATWAILLTLLAGLAPARDRSPWIRILLPLPLALALVLSGARGALAAVVLTGTVAALLGRGTDRRLLAGAAALLSLGLFLVPAPPETEPGRAEAWEAGLEILRERPLVGAGSYRDAAALHLADAALPVDAGSNLVQRAAEGGMIGLSLALLVWVTFYVAVVPRGWSLRRGQDPRAPLLWGPTLAVTCFHLTGLTAHTAGDPAVAILVLFLAGLPFGRALGTDRPPA